MIRGKGFKNSRYRSIYPTRKHHWSRVDLTKANSMSKLAKQGATVLHEVLQNRDQSTTTAGLTNIDDTPFEIGQSKP